MILVLISIFLIILGIICLIISNYKYRCPECIENIGLCSVITGGIFTIMCIVAFAYFNIGIDKQIYEYNLERESIIKQIECINYDNDHENVSKTIVIKNICDWNKKVYGIKYWTNNPWTSWFRNKRYANSLEYIELEDYNL